MINDTRIIVQEDDFCMNDEYNRIRELTNSDGAIVTFTGIVREQATIGCLTSMTLEHYPGMTESALNTIADNARERWPLGAISIIHRIGTLLPDAQIVFVGVSSKHRKSAFEASMFIMDYLKKDAPFWKKESTEDSAEWVEAKETDIQAAQAWETKKASIN